MIDVAICHRAAFAAHVAGVITVGRGQRLAIHTGALDELAGGGDLVVAVDAPSLVGDALADAASALARGGAPIALVVASPVAVALVAAARDEEGREARGADDAWTRARAWASARVHLPTAPSVTADRLEALATAFGAAGLGLAVPELTPPLARVRSFAKTPLDRAVLAVVAEGALALPLLVLPRAQATKVRLRPERALDGWVRRALGSTLPRATSPSLLVTAARAALDATSDPIPGKDLLRRARTSAAASAADAATVGADLLELWRDSAVDLYAVDPREPAWTVNAASRPPAPNS